MIHLFWFEQTEADLPDGDDWLSLNEAARLSGMRFLKRRNDFRLGRWTGKRALSLYLNLPAWRIEIRADPWGAPEALVDREQAGVNISLTHRDGVAACVIAPGQVDVGCDLELIESRGASFLGDYFTSEEQARVVAAAEQDRAALATLMWSAKEAALKLLRIGLRMDMRSIIVEPQEPPGEAKGWRALLCTVMLPGTEPRILNGRWRQRGRLVQTVLASRLAGTVWERAALALKPPTWTDAKNCMLNFKS